VTRALLPLLALSACVSAPTLVAAPPVALAPEQRTLAQETALTPGLASFAAQLRASGTARLASAGPFTVFAADDAAYARLSPGVAAALVEPHNRAMLIRFVDYHLVAGALDATELRRRVVAGGGRTVLPTLAGEAVLVTLTGDVLTLTDPDGDRAYLTGPQVVRPNGILHIVNGVIAPSLE
jgi:uncharacterized surface protein with fasciclin (FAS1) repeats